MVKARRLLMRKVEQKNEVALQERREMEMEQDHCEVVCR